MPLHFIGWSRRVLVPQKALAQCPAKVGKLLVPRIGQSTCGREWIESEEYSREVRFGRTVLTQFVFAAARGVYFIKNVHSMPEYLIG